MNVFVDVKSDVKVDDCFDVNLDGCCMSTVLLLFFCISIQLHVQCFVIVMKASFLEPSTTCILTKLIEQIGKWWVTVTEWTYLRSHRTSTRSYQ